MLTIENTRVYTVKATLQHSCRYYIFDSNISDMITTQTQFDHNDPKFTPDENLLILQKNVSRKEWSTV